MCYLAHAATLATLAPMLLPLAIAATTASLAAGGYHYAALWPQSRFFGHAILAGSNPAEVALTYDDGPNDPYTHQLLDVLSRHQIRATFFLIGQFAKQYPQVVKAVHQAGHLIGSHTMHHPPLMYSSRKRIRSELAATTAILEDTIGERVRYFRPPFGARRPELFHILREMDQVPVMWNVTAHDWNARSAAEIEERIERGILRNQRRRRGSNILLHDGSHTAFGVDRRRTVTATANLLALAPRGGMRFVTVDAWAAEPSLVSCSA
ncbi:MAG: polysaccharide deacetylase family protein [Acidobacteriaceae bacterium]